VLVSTSACQRTAVTVACLQAGAGQGMRADSAGSAPAVTDLDWGMDNDRLLAAAEDGSICVWLIDSGQLVCARAAQAVTQKLQ
jgi:WD40 repeat protein